MKYRMVINDGDMVCEKEASSLDEAIDFFDVKLDEIMEDMYEGERIRAYIIGDDNKKYYMNKGSYLKR